MLSSQGLLVLLATVATIHAQRNGDLRLARGSLTSSSYSSGRLEIYINGRWGTVCDDSFGFTDGNVACRQMGFTGASRRPTTASGSSLFRSGSGTIWLDDVGCTGSETCLLSCSNRGIGSHNCGHSEDVAIYCSGTRLISRSSDCSNANTQRNGDLRLARGSVTRSSYSSGRLEIYINGRWGTVCDDSFGFTDGNVACRQMGFTGASRRPTTASDSSLFRSGSGTIWLDDVGCTGSETCLLSCSNRGIGSHNCGHSEDVAIYCSGTRLISRSSDCSNANSRCTSSQFRCDNGQCIRSSDRCDRTLDCTDGSDETGCFQRAQQGDARLEEQAARQAGAILGAFLGVLLLLSVTWCLTLCICMRVSTCPLHNKYYKIAIQNLQAPTQIHEVQTGVPSLRPPAEPQTQQTIF